VRFRGDDRHVSGFGADALAYVIRNASGEHHEHGRRHYTDAPWRAEVLAKAAVLQVDADGACARLLCGEPPGRHHHVCQKVNELLERARKQAELRCGWSRRLRDWRTGGPIERAWRNLHGAEVLLAEVVSLEHLSSQRPAVLSLAKRILPTKDPRAKAIADRLADPAWDDVAAAEARTAKQLRRDYAVALSWVYDACDKELTRLRSFRNIVFAAGIGLAVVVIGLGVLGALSPESLPLCFDARQVTAEGVRGEGSPGVGSVCPTGVGRGPTGGDVPLVLVLGLAAGAFASVLTVRSMRGTCTPYGVPLAIAWLKLPAGAITALFAMLLFRGAFIPGLSALDSQGQIIAYAIVFGYAQQLLTRMVDHQAQAMLDRAPSTEPSRRETSYADDPSTVPELVVTTDRA
jgi:hypothetical protein